MHSLLQNKFSTEVFHSLWKNPVVNQGYGGKKGSKTPISVDKPVETVENSPLSGCG